MAEARRVLFFGTYDERTHPRVAGLRQGLAANGCEITVLNEPLGVDTAARVELVRRPRLAIGFGFTVLARWATLTRRRMALLRRPRPDVVVVGYLGHLDVVLARLLFPRSTIVLDLLVGLRDTADDRDLDVETGGRRILGVVLAGLDRLAQRVADVVVFDTAAHRDHLAPRGIDAVVVPVGAPADYFVADEAPDPPPLRVVFYGLYTPLQGATTIGAALALLDGEPVEATMIGGGQDRAEAEAAAGGQAAVRWIDWLPAHELPAVLAEHHVCLGIFGTSAKAARVVPNKVFQGAAAGAVVVTSDTAPQRRALGAAAIYVAPGDPASLARTLRTLASDPVRVRDLRSAARRVAEESFRPEAVVGPLVDHLWPGPSSSS